MLDVLWIAASGVAYARENRCLEGPDEFLFEFWIAPHPCDDQPYVAELDIVGAGWRTTQFDGSGEGDG